MISRAGSSDRQRIFRFEHNVGGMMVARGLGNPSRKTSAGKDDLVTRATKPGTPKTRPSAEF
jgi:hypothetical protein